MVSAAHSLAARGFTATATMANIRKNAPRPSTSMPGRISPSSLSLTATAPKPTPSRPPSSSSSSLVSNAPATPPASCVTT